jgi:cold shock CspA family protein
MTERKFGKVKHWNANSAYGFIAEDGCSKQHFFHIRDVVAPGVDDLPLGSAFSLNSETASRRQSASS